MISFNYTVKDAQGIHARPAGLLVKTAGALTSKVTLYKGEKTGDAKKIFGIMALSVKCGDEVMITVEGEKEEADAAKIKKFFEENL